MMYVGTQLFMTLEGAILVAALGIGDGIAPIIGKSMEVRWREATTMLLKNVTYTFYRISRY